MSDGYEYQIDGHPWIAGAGEELCGKFGLTPDKLLAFHTWAVSRPDLKIAWTATRMLYQICPAVPRLDGDPDYFTSEFGISQIVDILKIDPKALDLEWDMFARSWKKYAASLAFIPPPEPKPEEPPAIPTEVVYSDDPPTDEQIKLLKKHGFDLTDFDIEKGLKDSKKRPDSKRNNEIQWLCARLKDSERALSDPMGRSRMRAILVNELAARRIDERTMRMSPDDPSIDRMAERKDSIEKMLLQQWAEIEKVCPYVRQQVSKITAILAISETVQALREYRANKDNSLIDAVFTASEILVMDRESVQQESHYRPGWIAAMVEADSGLFDPNFQSKMPIAFCKTLDMAHLLAKKTINEKFGIKIPNLLLDGADGEYADLPELSESVTIDIGEETGKISLDDELIAAPLTSVPMEGDNGKPEPSVVGADAE